MAGDNCQSVRGKPEGADMKSRRSVRYDADVYMVACVGTEVEHVGKTLIAMTVVGLMSRTC